MAGRVRPRTVEAEAEGQRQRQQDHADLEIEAPGGERRLDVRAHAESTRKSTSDTSAAECERQHERHGDRLAARRAVGDQGLDQLFGLHELVSSIERGQRLEGAVKRDAHGALAHAQPRGDVGGAVSLEGNLLHDPPLALRQAREQPPRVHGRAASTSTASSGASA